MRNDDTTGRRMVGNFPQAFSHVALVNSAMLLANCLASGRQDGRRQPTAA